MLWPGLAAAALLSVLTALASMSVAQAALPEVARARDVAGARRANRTAAVLAVLGTLAGAGLLVVLQGTGFHRHSARVGVTAGVATGTAARGA